MKNIFTNKFFETYLKLAQPLPQPTPIPTYQSRSNSTSSTRSASTSRPAYNSFPSSTAPSDPRATLNSHANTSRSYGIAWSNSTTSTPQRAWAYTYQFGTISSTGSSTRPKAKTNMPLASMLSSWYSRIKYHTWIRTTLARQPSIYIRSCSKSISIPFTSNNSYNKLIIARKMVQTWLISWASSKSNRRLLITFGNWRSNQRLRMLAWPLFSSWTHILPNRIR